MKWVTSYEMLSEARSKEKHNILCIHRIIMAENGAVGIDNQRVSLEIGAVD
jgi:hypothetical protein